MTELRAMQWNINGRSDHDGRGYIPVDMIMGEIKEQSPDIAVLVEYYKFENDHECFTKSLEKEGFTVFCDSRKPERREKNQVLIAVSDKFDVNSGFIVKTISNKSTSKDPIPDYLQVTLSIDNQQVAIVGVRFIPRTGNIEKQLSVLKECLESTRNDKVVCLGDFNAWSSNLLNEYGALLPKNYKIETPGLYKSRQGEYKNSWGFEKKEPLNWSFVQEKKEETSKKPKRTPLDHLMTRNVEVTGIKYAGWPFLNEENGYGSLTPDDYKDVDYLPDHDILLATIQV